MAGANTLNQASLSEHYVEHLDKLFEFKKSPSFEGKISPLAFVDKSQRVSYLSFTIVDKSVLRIAIEGIYLGQDGPSSKVTGGFIIRDNKKIVDHFRELFLNMERLSDKFPDMDELNKRLS